MRYEDFHEAVRNVPVVFSVFRVTEITPALAQFNKIAAPAELEDGVPGAYTVDVGDFVYSRREILHTVTNDLGFRREQIGPANVEFVAYVGKDNLNNVKLLNDIYQGKVVNNGF